MKNYTLTFSIFSMLLFSGCPVTQVNRLPESSPLAHAAVISAVGDFKHDPSGYLFPAQVGAFQRVNLFRYDSGGLDVSAGYNDALPGCLVALTIYVYPTPRMTFVGADSGVVRATEEGWLGSAYTHAKADIVGAHPDAVLGTEGVTTQGGVSGKEAVYSIGKAESELDLFVVQHSWFLKFRASYPTECSTDAREALGRFRAEWTGRGG